MAALAIGKNMLSNQMSKITAPSSNIKINWEDFNFPPLLKLFHFSLEGLPEDYKKISRMLLISFIIACVNILLNIINQIAQTAAGFEGIRVFYAFLNGLILIPAAMFTFYRGYRGLCDNKDLLFIYKILQGCLIIVWILFSILDTQATTGFVRVGKLLDSGFGFQGVLGIIESVLYLSNAFFSALIAWKIHTFIPQAQTKV